MLRVVLDTNIYISAILFGGSPEKILDLAEAGELKVFISPAITEELQRILSQKFNWQAADIDKTARVISGFTNLVNPKVSVNILKRDPSDNRILECALEAKAELIVTGDTILQQLKQYKGMTIISPRQFMDTLEAAA